MCLYLFYNEREAGREVGLASSLVTPHSSAPGLASCLLSPQLSSTTHLPSSNWMHVGTRAQPRGGRSCAGSCTQAYWLAPALVEDDNRRARRGSWLSSSASACLSADAGMSGRRVRRCVSATSGRGTPRRRRGYDGGELIVPARRRRRRREWREERLAGAGEVQITIHRELTVIFRDAEPSGNPILPRGASPTRLPLPPSPHCASLSGLWPHIPIPL